MWVRQGRTDAWIAHKLDVSVDELARFKREHDLDVGEEATRAQPAHPLSVPPPAEPLDEPLAGELDEPPGDDEDEDEEPPRERSRRRSRRRPARRRVTAGALEDEDEDEDEDEGEAEDLEAEVEVEEPDRRPGDRDDAEEAEPDGGARRRRRRGRRGGRRHRTRRADYEATFDHGEEGYGLWLDPAVADNPVYSQHWAGHRAVTVTVEAEAITIRRAPRAPGTPPEPDPAEDS
jgi:hypothetical protein